MFGVKAGTQNWSTAKPDAGMGSNGFKTDSVQTNSALDKDKALGGEAVGDVLNKVADPNWVDPTKARKVGNNALDKDAFLKLMLTQMKNQDPTTPMQSHEMAAQLAQFTSLEQLNNIHTTLEGMSKAQSPSTNYQALNFIGKKVSGDSSKLTRVTGDTEHEFNFILGSDATAVKVQIKDSDGNTVKTLELKNLKAGQNSIKWNGINEDATAARPGEYKFVAEGTSSNGAKVIAKTEFEGRITGLNYTPQGPVLLVGQQSIRMQDVKRIEEANDGAQAPSTPLAPGQMPDLSMIGKAAGKADDIKPNSNVKKPVLPKAEDPQIKNNMTKNVAMSRAILDQVNKANDKDLSSGN
jgi:flagellar basal-body rod modification protein FlgD